MKGSLKSHIKRLALKWTVSTSLFAVALIFCLLMVFEMRDSQQRIVILAKSITSIHRSEILSGNIRTLELELQSNFALRKGETIIFLDENKEPLIKGRAVDSRIYCSEVGTACKNYWDQSVTYIEPIYFDDDHKALWGYLYFELRSAADWTILGIVAFTLVIGLFVQILGFYRHIIGAINEVSSHLLTWGETISDDPKATITNKRPPFSELNSIHNALSGLKIEIEKLETEARSEAVITTLRGIGHDILSPVFRMRRILGIMDFQSSTCPPAIHDQVTSLKDNLNRLSLYAEQIKLIYKQKLGENAETLDQVDLGKEIESILEELKNDPDILDKRIALQSQVEGETKIHVSKGKISRIIENLIRNAAQASNDGGKIKVTLHRTAIETVLEISDEGHGIPESIKNRVFEPDFTTKTSRGTGLGLYVVKKFCEEINASIGFTSRIGQGTAFYVRIANPMEGNT